MRLTIAERIRIAIGDGCEIRVLRERLADIEPGPLDYAIQGVIADGLVRLVDGYLTRVSSLQRALSRVPA